MDRSLTSTGRGPMSLRRVWLLAFVGFFLLPAAWALITPYNGAYDEHFHTVRAAGVVRGQILVPPVREYYDGGYQNVPRSLVPPNQDCLGVPDNPATCLGTASSDRTLVRTKTGAARYNPVYYAVVGWPLLPLPTMTGLVLARLVSALLCAALLASALVTVWPMRRYRLLLLAVLLSTTPMLISLNALVNPSGLETDASILLWAALVRLFVGARAPSDVPVPGGADPDAPSDASVTGGADPDATSTRRVVVRAIVAATVLVVGRPTGLGILAAIGFAVLVAVADRATVRPTVRALLRRRDVRIGAGAVAAATVYAVVWVVVSRISDFGHDAKTVTSPTSIVIHEIVVNKFDFWARGTVGLFGYATLALPVWVVVAWFAVQGMLVLLGFGFAPTRRHAYTVLAIPVVCFVVGFAVDMVMARKIGYFMQGRYFLPLWVGMFFLAALVEPVGDTSADSVSRLLGRVGVRRLYTAMFAIWGGSHLFGLYLMAHQYRYGRAEQPTGYPQTWTPIVGFAPPVLLMLAGVAVVGWLTWRNVRETAGGDGAGSGNVGEGLVQSLPPVAHRG
jgi:hypothetical protein